MLKNLSRWAKQHPRPARLLIAVGRILLAFLSFSYGLAFAVFDQFSLLSLAWCGAVAYPIAFMLYPRRRPDKTTPFPERVSTSHISTYFRRKVCDGLLVISSCLFYVCAGNWLVQPDVLRPAANTNTLISAQSSMERTPAGQITLHKHQWLKKIRKEARHFVWKMRVLKNASKPLPVAVLLLLSLLIIIVLGYLTLAVSCSLSCSGQEGAALFILFGGIIAIILSLALLWQNQRRSTKDKDAVLQRSN